LRRLSIGLAIVGVMIGTLLIGWYGFQPTLRALLSVSPAGFLAFCGWQLLTMAALGLCWRVVAPVTGAGRAAPFVWGRIVRDSAGSCLPFSVVGGFVLGIRAAVLHGVAGSIATLSLVVDLTSEFVAEILFAIAGLLVLLVRSPDQALTRPILVGLAAALLAGGLVLVFQKRAAPLLLGFGRNILHGRFASQIGFEGGEPSQNWEQWDRDLAAVYSRGGRIALCIAGHIVGWVFKGVGNWIAFRLLGADIDLVTGLAIEGLLHALLIPAFVVPGYAGVQEVGYAGLGVLFGIPPQISLSVSLLRRARDLTIGIPVLLIWQLVEMRRLHKPSPAG
jgi:glycosyltransferase 2 family protein